MQEGVETPLPEENELSSGASGEPGAGPAQVPPLDGVAAPLPATGEAGPEAGATPVDHRRNLLLLLALGGSFLLFYVVFAFVLMATLPDPSGGRRGLWLFGNLFYGGVSIVALALLALLALRLLRAGVAPAQIGGMLLRPGVVLLVMLGMAGMVFAAINREVPLPIDVLEPENLQGLTAPVTITFGTETLRNILRRQSLYPRRYQWDFQGDGKPDAERQEHDVTTVYRRKGIYTVVLTILLADGTVRSTSRRIVIPTAVFSVTPSTPLREEEVTFNATDLLEDPRALGSVLWDFEGDGKVDAETNLPVTTHRFTEAGTFQVTATLQMLSGVLERTVRPVTVLMEAPQLFAVAIETEGPTKGSSPLGVIFRSRVQEGIPVRTMRWFLQQLRASGEAEKKQGERLAHTFTVPGEYRVTLEVADTSGRTARATITVSVFEPLRLPDLMVSGSPKPANGRVEGTAPLEVRLAASTKTPFIVFRWEQEHASNVFSSEPEFHAVYEEPGTYPVLLVAKDEEERLQKLPLEIVVHAPKSRVTFTAVPSTGIAPLMVVFDASQSFVQEGRITGYAWTFGDGKREEEPQLFGAQVTHRFEKEGTYTVIVRALTEEGQSYEARKTVVVRSAALDACAFPSRTAGSAPLGVRFDASCSTGAVTKYVWDFGDGELLEGTTSTQDHIFQTPGVYAVKLEITDGKGNFSTTTVTITVR